tara:strand:- start:814 stop:1542 length:729 start_codon:yes stop_codon:yes gene_type:complete
MSAHEGNRTVRRRRASLLRLPGCVRTVLAAIVLTAAAAAPAPAAKFADVTAALGITFRHDAAPSGDYELPEIMGAGMAIFDYNGDGALDLYFVGTAAHSDRLYCRGADGRYTDVTREARLQPRAVGMGTSVGDIDNDGDLDLYLTSVGPDQLHRNNGTFSDVSVQAGIEAQGWSSSATFCDIDADGYPDLFVGTYVSAAPSDARTCTTAAGQHDYCPPNVYPTRSDRLFRNMGDGSFTDVTD